MCGYKYLSRFWLSVAFAIQGVVLCMTIIGIPFGLQHFKLAKLALMPFGATVHDVRSSPSIGTNQNSSGQ
ncbi:MAG TPA: hypothetical protein GXZ59_00745 [Clostridiaceae bacterium]|nr:hypothetical protein [Clostridiaceae bacterium]